MKKLKWTSISEYVDEETGEILTKKQVEEYYIIIKKVKYGNIDNTTNTGIIRWINVCTKRGKQKKLF